MTRLFIGISLWTLWSISFCTAQSDTSTLHFGEYLEHIVRFHPTAERSNLKTKLAKAQWMEAKGNLDPTLGSLWNQKNFDEKLYFRQNQGKFRLPTVLGLDFVGGYENTEGVFLNPENRTDNFGLWNIGLEIDILQGLIINERKTALDQARVFQNLAENERQEILNELLYKASLAYLNWQKYFHFHKVLLQSINIAHTYFNNTKVSFLNGEKTAIDTLEAYIMLQDAKIYLQNNDIKYAKAKQTLENYLWYNNIPITLNPNTIPEHYNNLFFKTDNDNTIDYLVANHPSILSYRNKYSYFEIEQKLKRERLKPKLKLKYNPLLATSDSGITPNYSVNDFKWGFAFSMPLFFRKAKAGIRKGEIKLKEIQLEIENKQNQLRNKIEASLQQQKLINEQLQTLKLNVERYQILLEAENEKFKFGESSVFLLNKRQEKYINGQLKLIELKIKLQEEILRYLYYSNALISR